MHFFSGIDRPKLMVASRYEYDPEEGLDFPARGEHALSRCRFPDADSIRYTNNTIYVLYA